MNEPIQPIDDSKAALSLGQLPGAQQPSRPEPPEESLDIQTWLNDLADVLDNYDSFMKIVEVM